MRGRSVVLIVSSIALALVSTIHLPAAQGATRQVQPQEEVLPALLVEVRGLRAAMEQMASAGPRVQLALGRVQLQEQRVNNLMRRIEDSRAHLAEAQRNYDNFQQQLRGLESALREPQQPNGPPVAELEQVQRMTQRSLTQASAELQRLTAEAAVLESDLATEQGRWIDLNQRMEALEQSLVRR
jgi:chromosome segregation ATPase